MSNLDRRPPHNLDAEQAVLGAVLIDPDAIHKVMTILKGEDFFSERHRWMWEAAIVIVERRQPIDYVALVDELERQHKLEEVGGSGYITSLINTVPTAANVESYAQIVERAATLRRLISAAGEIAGLAFADEGNLDDIIDKSEQAVFAVSQRKLQRDLVPISQLLHQVHAHVDYMQAHKGEFVGVPTGFNALDKLLGGLQSSDLIIIAARPSIGKTSYALNLAQYAATHPPRKTVAVFSLEMAGEQIVQRIIANMTGIDGQRLRLGQLNDDEYDRMTEAIGRLSEAPIYIDDTPAASPNEIRSKSRRLFAERGLDMIVIDYLQLMRSTGRIENRVQEIAQISRSLKALARELKVPVIALSQLSRAVEARPDKRPQLSDLRESGCLSGETLIYLPEQGIYQPIAKLVGQSGFKALALNTETWKLEPHVVTRAFATGYKSVYCLQTRLGHTIRATANHKFLTVDGWQRLDRLSTGIHLAQALKDVCWDEIIAIEPDGETEVYDLTVEGLHNFVANDIIAHNSIEQDADVVMFLYREDAYDRATERPNIMEIIVAKHRNGPTGSVELHFNRAQSRFADLEYYKEDGDPSF